MSTPAHPQAKPTELQPRSGSDPALGSGTSADNSSPRLHPSHSDPEPVSYFELQRARMVNPGEEKVSSDISTLPPQPGTSPWGSGPQPGDEPTIDRTEDASFINQEDQS
jgi:hypothetical protein